MSQVSMFRKDLHQIPELGFEEVKTQAYLLHHLEKLGCEITTVRTGIVAYFDQGAETTLAFRCDMDALPITEATGLPFASTHKGKMHACGHDGHMAILLGLAYEIAQNRASLNKNVVLVFQPSEERDAGANVIIDSGLLQKYGVSEMYGLHLWPKLNKGQMYSRPGAFMAGASEVDVIVHGEATHIANTGEGINAMHIGARLILDINALDEDIPEDQFSFIRFGKMVSGVAQNVVSPRTEFNGTIRTFAPATMVALKRKLEAFAKTYEEVFNTTIDIVYRDGYAPVLNNAKLLEGLIAKGINIQSLDKPSMTAEDFGLYAKIVPTVFFFLGVGDVAPLHHEAFDFDMTVLDQGVAFFKDIIGL